VAREGRTILANDVTKEARYRPSPFPPEDTRSELTIPLVFNNHVEGVLDLQSDRIDAFPRRIIFYVKLWPIASHRHPQCRPYQTERWRRQVADSLRDVAGSISAEIGVDDVWIASWANWSMICHAM